MWLRPFRDLVYAMPPYVIDDDDLAEVDRGDGRRGGGGSTAMRVIAVAGTDTGVGKTDRHRRSGRPRPRPRRVRGGGQAGADRGRRLGSPAIWRRSAA